MQTDATTTPLVTALVPTYNGARFIERTLEPLVRTLPGLKIVFEHITTAEAAQFVADAPANIAATITPQHLHINRNAMLVGGIRPHAYCLPVAKREHHRLAVRAAATSGSPKFFLGTDSAPHAVHTKEASCGCAGIFNAPYALESYATAFDEDGALTNLEVIDAQREARDAETASALAEDALIRAKFDLLVALGRFPR